MSTPANPLDQFRTYSYHHILVVCDSTETADDLAKTSQLSALDHPNAKYTPKYTSSGGGYVVMINGMSDAQFFIKSAKWSSVAIPVEEEPQRSAVASSTLAVDGEITIEEPQGINFFMLLNEITKQLQIDSSLVVFMLKTVFVGETDTGQVDVISSIRPFKFIATNIEAQFGVTGAEYTLEAVGMMNGMSRSPHVNAIVSSFTFDIPPGTQLVVALQEHLTKQINKHYGRERDLLFAQMEKCLADEKSKRTLDTNQFSKVTYDIKIDDFADYRGYGSGDYQAGSNTPASQQNTGQNDAIITGLGTAASIEDIIDAVMKSSEQVMKDAQAEPSTGNRYTYKISSSMETKPTGDVTITYYVNKFEAQVVDVDPEQSEKSSNVGSFENWSPPTVDGKVQGIKFDYIFTGQNIDVIDFDISMKYGLVFFQTLGAHSTTPTNREHLLSYYNPHIKVGGAGNVDGSGDQRNGVTVKKPLFLGTMTKNPSIRDMRRTASTASYNTLLQRQAFMENIEVEMKIRGNPQLLEDTTQDVANIRDNQPPPKVPYSDQNVFPHIHRVPGYVKVDVWMPIEWNLWATDVESNIANASGDYATNFWYKGWYILLQIDHEFSDGEFEQTLHMYSMPTNHGQTELGKCFDEFRTQEKTGDKPSQEQSVEEQPIGDQS